MPVETLTAFFVRTSNFERLNSRYTPLNTFMFAGSTERMEIGTWIVTLEVVTDDPFNPGWTRRAEWNWNVTAGDLERKYMTNEIDEKLSRFELKAVPQ